MMSLTVSGVVTCTYLLFSGLRLFAYIPQIGMLVRRECIDGVSIGSWTTFTAAHASTALYAVAVQRDAALAITTVFNVIACLLIVGLAWQRRRERQRCVPARPIVPFATTAARRPRAMLLCPRADAAFFDGVARDQGRAVGLHLGPFGLATGIRMRTARVKSAA